MKPKKFDGTNTYGIDYASPGDPTGPARQPEGRGLTERYRFRTAALHGLWDAALRERARLSPRSIVPVLDALLAEQREP